MGRPSGRDLPEHTQSSQTGLRHYEVRPLTSDVPHEGGFRSNQEKALKPHHAGRAQRLHDVSSRGRAYDIISGARTPVAPSRLSCPRLKSE